jgi:hypothetical protein
MDPVEYVRDLGDGVATDEELADAAEAIKLELHETSKRRQLRCLRATRVGDDIYALEVPRYTEIDWTWEGARAFRSVEDGQAWQGEIVEVDPVSSQIFVAVDGPAPHVGDFFAQPYEFLASLHELYARPALAPMARDLLKQGLCASAGRLYPRGDTAPGFERVWNRSWGVVWGPPGTGKTYSAGVIVAAALRDPTERLLVVSTTNKATDEIALSIGHAVKRDGHVAPRHNVVRLGGGADSERYRKEGLEDLLVGDVMELRRHLADLRRVYEQARSSDKRAQIMAMMQEARRRLAARRPSTSSAPARVVVSTAFAAARDLATQEVVSRAQRGRAVYTTLVIDEAGLVPRAAVAALSMLAARRVILAGDPKQLSPISRMSRVLHSKAAMWIGSSALTHVSNETPAVCLLETQRRMHPDIRRVVSEYRYDGRLRDDPAVLNRYSALEEALGKSPRAIWYVLDEDTDERAHLRAERGPGNKSWVRQGTREVLNRIFRAYPHLREARGLFLSPFVGQARDIAEALRASGAKDWSVSTVHRQQGAEAPVVVFDTVNASSTAWSYGEWQRLINVAMSRAQSLLVVVASRSEMGEAYARPLARLLTQVSSAGVEGGCAGPKSPASTLQSSRRSTTRRRRSEVSSSSGERCARSSVPSSSASASSRSTGSLASFVASRGAAKPSCWRTGWRGTSR